MKIAAALGAIANLIIMFTPIALAETGPHNSLSVPLPPELAASERSNLPPVGRSLFDFLVSTGPEGGSGYRIPFPFDRFIEQLRGKLGANPQALKVTLIPLGRSLQRTGAAPDYFHFPRVVVAITDNPTNQSSSEPGQRWLLKDRLYLGYQERMSLIEVISYNETAGRFEFQLVKNYGPGLSPEVYYTDRVVCGACHQSHSPIFSKAPWDETAANPLITALLKKQRDQFYGIAPTHGADTPEQIDAATNRAAFFAIYNQLWGRGCALNNTLSQTLSCRQRLLRELLRMRLSNSQGVDNSTADFRDGLLARWDQVWPEGLALPNVDLPNRAPLQGHRPTYGQPFKPIEFGDLPEFSVDEVAMLAQVDPVFEPSNKRAPLARLTSVDMQSGRFEWLLGNMSTTLMAEDIRLIDQHLVKLRDQSQAEQLEGRCEGKTTNIGEQVFTKLHCQYSSGMQSGWLKMRLPGSFAGSDNPLESTNGHITEMNWGSQRLTQLVLQSRAQEPGSWKVKSILNGLHARFPDGWGIAEISLLPEGNHSENDRPDEEPQVEIKIRLQSDFEQVDRALLNMVSEVSAGENNSLTRSVLQQSRLMSDLFKQLDMPSIKRCCKDIADMAEPQFSASLAPESHLQ